MASLRGENFDLRLAYSFKQSKCTGEGHMPSVYYTYGHSSRENGNMQADTMLEKN